MEPDYGTQVAHGDCEALECGSPLPLWDGAGKAPEDWRSPKAPSHFQPFLAFSYFFWFASGSSGSVLPSTWSETFRPLR